MFKDISSRNTSDVLLTVIVLTYNSDRTVGSCLQSLVDQVLKDFTIIVVDDMSDDNTLQIVAQFKESLSIDVLINGAHSIPRGRNIGLDASDTPYVAFLDSDDTASCEWTSVIVDTLSNSQDCAIISGDIVSAWRTRFAQACACNDSAIRKLATNGSFTFSTCNCAFKRELVRDIHFDEGFRYSEDMEWLSRIVKLYRWRVVDSMKVYHESRGTVVSYARQMCAYGMWRLFYSFRTNEYRMLDFVPLAVIVAGLCVSIVSWSVIPALVIVALFVGEALFVSVYARCSVVVSLLIFVAWVTKNLAWSVGIAYGIVRLCKERGLREWLKRGPGAGSGML